MLTTYLYTFASIGLISLISLIGVFALSMNATRLRAILFVLVSLAVGALLGDAFLHLIPEAFETATNPTNVALAILGGILFFFVIEKVLHWHHHQGIETTEPSVHPVGKIIIFSDGVHNLIDGLIIGLAYSVSIEVGIATTIAVILHEIPQEIGDFGVLIHAGYSRAKALWLNFASALFAFIGAGAAFVIGEAAEPVALVLLPIAAGGFIYIALSDLIPELHKTKSARQSLVQLAGIGVGIFAMFLLLDYGHVHADEDGHGHDEETHIESVIEGGVGESPLNVNDLHDEPHLEEGHFEGDGHAH